MSQSSSVEYNTKAVRELVTAAFTDEDFWIFCYDHFPAVYQKFSTGMTYTHKVHLLIEYCSQTNSFGPLLRLVKEINPNKYAQYRASLYRKPKVAPQQTPAIVSNVATPPPTKIFISYSWKQLGVARRLAENLQQAGFAVWWDVSDLKGGAEWERAIQAAIKTSQYCLILLTPDSVESEWVHKEYMYAISLHLQVIPLLYRNCEIPLALTGIQYLDFRGDNCEQSLKELLANLRSATVTPQPIPPTLKDKLLALTRAPMWQTIGVIVAVLTLGWAAYIFYVDRRDNGLATSTPTGTIVVSAPPATHTPTSVPTRTPTNTPTPTPSTTPLPALTSTATIDADPTIYDNFNDPTFNGHFNTKLWSMEEADFETSQMVQQNGILMLSDTERSSSGEVSIGLRNWEMTNFEFFEVKMLLSSDREGTGVRAININAESFKSYDIPGGWTEMGISNSPANSPTAVIFVKIDGNPAITRLNAKYDTWYTMRIEFDVATDTFSYFVNERLIATYELPSADSVQFRPVIQLSHDLGTSNKAFVDDVRIIP